MGNRHSYSFIMEYIIAIVMFVICATICISVFASSYKKNEVANVTKKAIEEVTTYIELGDYSNKAFSKDDVTYSVVKKDDKLNTLLISATYENKELFAIEFYGGDYE